jgi:hypothetical protein
MAIDFAALMLKADGILADQGLYTVITYLDVSESFSNYDPETGEFSSTASVEYTFNGVLLNTDFKSDKDENYDIPLKIIVMASEITFTPSIDQIFTINGIDWQVSSFQLAPQDTIYTFYVKRK